MKTRSLKKSLVALATSAALLAGGSVALAGGEDPGAWKIGGAGLWVTPSDSRGLENGYGFELSIGWVLNESWDMDLNYFSSGHDVGTGGPDRDLSGVGIDFDRVFMRSSGVSPFVTFGAGFLDDDVHRDYEDQVMLKIGAGFIGDLATSGSGGKLQLKTGIDMRYQFQGFVEPVFYLGLQYAWAGRAPVVR